MGRRRCKRRELDETFAELVSKSFLEHPDFGSHLNDPCAHQFSALFRATLVLFEKERATNLCNFKDEIRQELNAAFKEIRLLKVALHRGDLHARGRYSGKKRLRLRSMSRKRRSPKAPSTLPGRTESRSSPSPNEGSVSGGSLHKHRSYTKDRLSDGSSSSAPDSPNRDHFRARGSSTRRSSARSSAAAPHEVLRRAGRSRSSN